MVTDIGLITLFLAGVCGVFALAAAVIGAQEKRPEWLQSGYNALMAMAALLTLAALTVVYANLANDFRLEYTTQVSSYATPWYLKITALWGGQNGSLLFWVWLMALFCAGSVWRQQHKGSPIAAQVASLLPYVTAIMAVTLVFFIGLVLFYANPFARLWQSASGEILAAVWPPAGAVPFTAADGRGLAPLLRHPGMIIHPPFLYLGFVGFIVPFAFALAALIANRSDSAWLRATRRWTLAAWLFLSIGLLLGMRWAYDVLGWGGYWGWDAVENAALMPWLSATAFVHSVIIQEKRGMLKVWNMFLIIFTFCQVIVGTFITRTGIVSSVHSFARSSIGVPFMAFTAVTLVGSIGLLLYRLEDLKSENRLDNLLSREAAFLLQNVLFLLINFVVILGTYFPILSELFTDNKITVGPPYYNQTVGPLLVPLVLLMGIAPLVSWRAASLPALGRLTWLPAALATIVIVLLAALHAAPIFALVGFWIVTFTAATTLIEYGRGAQTRHTAAQESYPLALWNLIGRNRRRYGGYLIHIAVVLIALGIIGTNFYQVETQRSLEPGQALTINDYTLRFVDLHLKPTAEPDKQIVEAEAAVTLGNGSLVTLRPFQEIYENGERMTPPVLIMSFKEDLYVLLAGWEGKAATFKVYVNPLVNWMWLGGILFIIGTLVAAWPTQEKA